MSAFARIDLRIGRIVEAIVFAKARKPAYKLKVDFGAELGVRSTSAQLSFGYPDPGMLVGQLVVAVANFPPRNIAGFMSQVLVTGFYADELRVLLLQPCSPSVALGARVGLFGKDLVQPSDQITFDVFNEAMIVLGEVVQVSSDRALVDCGNGLGTADCNVPSAVKAGDRVAVLVGKEPGLLAVQDDHGRFAPLTSDGCVPLGKRLV